jgi:hypothetical protein
MKALSTFVLLSGLLLVSACQSTDLNSITERAIVVKDVATATIDAVCKEPENNAARVDIRVQLAKISSVDSRLICTEGLDAYLTKVVSERLVPTAPATATPTN